MKYLPGPMIGQASGSLGNTTFSRNRYGSYTRNRVSPVLSTTTFATNAKAHLADASAGWAALTADQRLQWITWANTNPVIDSLGQKQVLTGHAGYVQLNTRRLRDAQVVLTAPPIIPEPSALDTMSITLDIGAGAFGCVFTATPLAAGLKLWLREAVVNSAGINYVDNLLKLVTITAAAQASPYDFEADSDLRFGALQVGQYVHLYAHVYDSATGLLSQPLKASGIVTTT